MSIHPSAGRGFAAAVESTIEPGLTIHARRVVWLTRELRIGASNTVFDLGAGTGKLTRPLAEAGATVIAVEPVAEMRAHLSETTHGVEILDGRAEASRLPDCSADAVTAGQASTGFAPTIALVEMHRVLRPDGRLGLIWNVRDIEQPLQASLDAIVSPHERHTPAHQWQAELASTPLFTGLKRRQFRWEADWDAERFVTFASLAQRARRAVEPPTRSRADGGTEADDRPAPALQGRVPYRRLPLREELTTHATGHQDRLGPWTRRHALQLRPRLARSA
jgi:SAM-dependent methyltransferase